jgi:hypothetical protein
LKPPRTSKLVEPRVQEILCENHGLLVPPLVDHFQVNKAWFKVMGKILAWEVLKIVKFNNATYYHTIVIQGLPRLSLKVQLTF